MVDTGVIDNPKAGYEQVSADFEDYVNSVIGGKNSPHIYRVKDVLNRDEFDRRDRVELNAAMAKVAHGADGVVSRLPYDVPAVVNPSYTFRCKMATSRNDEEIRVVYYVTFGSAGAIGPNMDSSGFEKKSDDTVY